MSARRKAIPLASLDRRENFILDLSRYQIKLTKATFQNRVRRVIVLLRLDIDGPPHRNPDGEEIPCPHIHLYREGFGDKWAMPVPVERYPHAGNLFATFEAFVRHCIISPGPRMQMGLF